MDEQEQFAEGLDVALRGDQTRASWLAEEARALGAERELRAVSDLTARQEQLLARIDGDRRAESAAVRLHSERTFEACRVELHALEHRIDDLKHAAIQSMSSDLDRARADLSMMHSRASRLRVEGKDELHAAMARLERGLDQSGASIAAFAQTRDDHWAAAKERFDHDWKAVRRENEAYQVALSIVARTALGAAPLGLFDNWWVVALRGVLGLSISAVVLSSTTMRLSFVTVVGAYALINGLLQSIEAVAAGARREHWQMLLAAGIIGVIVGILALTSPITTGISLLLIAAWAISQGVLEAIAARLLRVHLPDEWILATHSAAWIVFGLLTIALPMTRVDILAALLAAFLFASGLLLISLGLRMWTIRRRLGGVSESSLTEPA